jgi:DNA mismatch repair protein MutL
MGIIQQLPEEIAIKIAAGEVVERPASVIKELVENALDAGATQIDVSLEQGGKTVIEVQDNGSGMDRDDAVKAFLRHGTSKIREIEDLTNVTTLGFRGEALAAIAASALVELTTTLPASEEGTQVKASNAAIESVKPHSPIPGTNIRVTELFSSLPARQKFLKSEATEWKASLETLVKQIITHPEVGFTIKHNSRLVYQLAQDQLFVDRVSSVWKIPTDELVSVNSDVPHMNLTGVVAKPEVAHDPPAGGKNRQFFAVNGHPVTDKVVAKSVKDAFGTFLPPGLYPSYALNLTIHPGMVDVNIHPRKDEVRFINSQEIFRFVFQSVSQALGGQNLSFSRVGESDQFLSPPLSPNATQPFSTDSSFFRSSGGDGIEKKYPPDQSFSPDVSPSREHIASPIRHATFNHVPVRSVLEDTRLNSSLPDPVLSLDHCYLVTLYVDQLLLVDQHAAHERILYHKFWEQDNAKDIARQNLLIPAELELAPEEEAVFNEHKSEFEDLGFSFGTGKSDKISITAVPSLLRRIEPNQFFHSLLQGIGDDRNEPELKDFKHKLFATMACKAAIKAGDSVSESEKRHVIDELMALPDRFTCPHGRPSHILISSSELEKLFKRTGF